ncbi:MAG: putative signal transducing protein [Arenicella sp.]
MELVYEPANAIEGQLIINMLQQADIEAHMHGANLHSVIGEVQAFGLVRIFVAAGDYEKAKDIIDNWNNADIL